MKSWFTSLSLRYKIFSVIALNTLLVISIVIAYLAYEDWQEIKKNTRYLSEQQAALISNNMARAITTKNAELVRQSLRSLDSLANLTSAVFLSKNLTVIAVHDKKNKHRL